MTGKKNYPIDSLDLESALEIAEKLNELGGKASKGLFAEAIGHKTDTSGPFRAKLSSLKKYNLVDQKEDDIILTQLGINVVNSYEDNDKKLQLFKVFNKIPLFKEVLERLNQSSLNLEFLDKIFIKDYGVSQKHAHKLQRCFIESAKFIEILSEDDTLNNKNIQSYKNQITDDENMQDQESYGEKQKFIEHQKLLVKDHDLEEKLKDEKLNLKNNKFEVLNEDLFDLITLISTYPLNKSNFEDINNILEHYENLTHTNLIFKAIKENFENDSVTEDNLKILLEGLKKDFNIK